MRSKSRFCIFLVISGLIHSFCVADLIVDLNTGSLTYGNLSTWPNEGLLGGSFTSSGNPKVEDIDGHKAVTFDGNDNFVSTFNVPNEITGNNSYTVAVWAYNPSIANEECMVNWAKRGSTARAAQLNYGTSSSYGAVTHWTSTYDMGFDGGVPSSGQWHHIAVTYQGGPGSLETVYVDGVRNAIEYKTLNLWQDGVFYLGCAIQSDESSRTLYFSGSLSHVQVYDTELSESQIQALVVPIVLNETDGETVVSEAGDTDTYEIVLGMQPSSDVTITIDNDGRTQTNVLSVTFTDSNWDSPQTVTVSAVDNSIIEGAQTSVLTHNASSSDPTFDGLSVELGVQVLDNDRLGDFSSDGDINFDDLLLIAQEWINDCTIGDFCNGTDLTGLMGLTNDPGRTDLYDYSIFSDLWQQGPILITEFMASNGNNFVTLMNGLEDDPDWIELYNAGPNSIDLAGWYLTDDLNNLMKWQFPSVVLEAGRYMVVFASGQTTTPYVDDLGYQHTNFQLNTDGEDLAVVRPDGQTISHFWQAFPEQETDYSYGLVLQNLQEGYFQTPTPNATNGSIFEGFVADTRFSRDRGFYTQPFDVEITCQTPGAVIYYTTDGSIPTETSTEYTSPITISETTFLRARAFKTGLMPTNTDTQTYLFLDDFWTQSRPAGYPTDTYDSQYDLDYDIDQDVIGPGNLFGDVYRDTYISNLQALPSMSIVMDVDDLFGIDDGIYANSIQEGEAWERAASVEMIDPNEGDLFQVDCAIRLQGGYSRNAFESPKHNFRFIFSRPYGPPKLRYRLFPDSEVDEFDQLIVRTPCHDSWLTRQSYFRNEGLYASDGWHREIQRQMGHVSAHGRWVHLYLNGLYWGIHEVVERPNAAFAASYYGGDKQQYDCIATVLRDGTTDAWDTMFSIAAGNGPYGSITNPQAYAQIQEYLDVTNLADYFIINFYSAISDWPGFNYYACRKREPGAQFRFYCWDSEACFMSDRLYFNRFIDHPHHNLDSGIGILFLDLTANEEFQLLLADRLHKHLHNDGVLNPTNAAAVYQAQLDRVEVAMGPESARWGDAWESTPLTRADWESDQQWLFSTFFPQRSEIVIDDFRDEGIYPQTDPPDFSRYTGYASVGDTVSMTNPNGSGTIYYTMDGSDPRQNGNEYSDAVTLSKSSIVKSRVLDNTEWSAATEAIFAMDSVGNNLRITEIMYHPADPNHEFIELKNIGAEAINLNLVEFTRGVHHTFDDVAIGVGGYALLVRNQMAFEAYYTSIPAGVPVIQWQDGALDNDEDKVQVTDALGQPIQLFTYRDGWYPLTDGSGFSLTVVDPLADASLWGQKENWRSSTMVGGSPGQDEIGLNPGSIEINELLAHSDDILPDWIELHNTTEQSISIGGWFLSDNDANLVKYEIPNGTEIQAGGYVVLYENTHFGNAFAFSENGETVYLTSGAGGQITGYQAQQDFDASERGVSMGRYITSTNDMDFVALSSTTPGAVNAYPMVGPIVITEIQYNPALNNTGGEYIKLHNISDQEVYLESLSTTETAPGVFEDQLVSWSFTRGIDYLFPTGTSIEAGGFLIVAQDPSAFNAYYTSLSPGTQVLGPFANDTQLSNGGEKVRLSKPGEQLFGLERSWIRVDQVNYDDEIPWPIEADGQGDVLSRINESDYGNDPINWDNIVPNP